MNYPEDVPFAEVFPHAVLKPESVSTESTVPGVSAAMVSDIGVVVNDGVSPVQQQFKDESDINTIVRRFGMTGQLPLTQWRGVYGDFSGITDFESAVARVQSVEERFMELPVEVREKFENSPQKLLEFVNTRTPAEWEAFVAPPVAAVPPPVAGGGGGV